MWAGHVLVTHWLLIGEERLLAEDLCGDMQTCLRVFQTGRESTD